jgi:ubiquinone biosynthesis protein UbiJ
MLTLETPAIAAVNHLLGGEPGARARLAAHAGKVIEVAAEMAPTLRFAVTADGTLEAAPSGTCRALRLRLGPAALAALARDGGLPGERFVEALGIEGDAELAELIGLLLRHLRWDVEAALAPLLGDIAAHRLAGAARGLAAWPLQSAARAAESFSIWLAQDGRQLVGRAEYATFRRELAELTAALERLAARLR